jgi:hypothetical protein
METSSEEKLVKSRKRRFKDQKEVKLKKPRSNNLKEVKPRKPTLNDQKEVKPKKPRSNNLKEVKPRKPRSKEQAIKCQFCPRSFSFLHWNNGKKIILVPMFSKDQSEIFNKSKLFICCCYFDNSWIMIELFFGSNSLVLILYKKLRKSSFKIKADYF